jgi:hypothetical protein
LRRFRGALKLKKAGILGTTVESEENSKKPVGLGH